MDSLTVAPLPEASAKYKIRPSYLVPAFVFVSYLLWIFFGNATRDTYATVIDTLVPTVSWAGVIWSVWGFRQRNRDYKERGGKRGTLSPNLLTLGLSGYGTGSGILCFYRYTEHVKPVSSVADLFMLAGALLVIAGLLFFPSRRLSGVVRARLLLDSLMIMTALVTFSWFFTLGPTVLDAKSTALGKALNAIYPMTDLVMMFCVLAASARTGDRHLRWSRNMLCLAVLSVVVADVAFLYLTVNGKYQGDSPFDVGFLMAPFLCGQAVYALRNYRAKVGTEMEQSDADARRATPLWRSLLPYALVPAVACLMFEVWRSKSSPGLADGVYIGAAVLIALILVRQVFAIVENSRLYRFLQEAYRELEALATTDGMTGLWNHRTFQERFRSELDGSKISGQPVTLLLIDVDRFKTYNDHYGHPEGDKALRLVAKILKENVRAIDLPARYGGEEFAAVLPATSETEGMLVADRIREACEAQPFPCRPVTLSIGVVTRAGGEADDMIEDADRALYVAKHRGRNQVVLAGASIEPNDSALETGDEEPLVKAKHNPRLISATEGASAGIEEIKAA
jgi:diguanylate cyclase (GGDEF)-like protein